MNKLPEPPEDSRTIFEQSEDFLDYLEDFLDNSGESSSGD